MSVYRSRVNQKLFFGGLLAGELALHADVHHQRLRLESLLFQLYLGYRFHLRHVGASYQCRNPQDIDTVEDLVQQLAEEGKPAAEAAEIQALLGAPESWLKSMLAAYSDCLGVPQETSGSAAKGLIPATLIEGPEQAGADDARQWLQSLVELIERQRETMIEY